MSACPTYHNSPQGDERFDGIWTEFCILLPIIIIMQFAILSHTIYHEITRRHQKQFKKVPIKSRLSFYVLQILGLWWTICDFLRLTIDPGTYILHNHTTYQYNAVCSIVAYTPKIMPCLYYLVYLYQILMRLRTSFIDSYLEISKHVYGILLGSILIPMIIGPITFFIFNSTETTCIAKWNPKDFPQLGLTYCEYQIRPYTVGAWVYTLSASWIPIVNIIFGIIFSVKLNKILSKNNSNENMKFKF